MSACPPPPSGIGLRPLVVLTLTAWIALAPGAGRAGGIIDDKTLDYSKLTCAELQTLIADDVKKGQKQAELLSSDLQQQLLAAEADAFHDEVIDGTTTFRQSMRLQNAVLLGKASGLVKDLLK